MEKAICPICNKDLLSDANAPNFCKLCGMIIDEDTKSKEFCCKDCKTQFDKIKTSKRQR